MSSVTIENRIRRSSVKNIVYSFLVMSHGPGRTLAENAPVVAPKPAIRLEGTPIFPSVSESLANTVSNIELVVAPVPDQPSSRRSWQRSI